MQTGSPYEGVNVKMGEKVYFLVSFPILRASVLMHQNIIILFLFLNRGTTCLQELIMREPYSSFQTANCCRKILPNWIV